jgi:hypothetical protein
LVMRLTGEPNWPIEKMVRFKRPAAANSLIRS